MQHALQERSGTARAATHILAHTVMEQNKAGIQVLVEIIKRDDDRRGALRQAQKTVGKIICILNLNPKLSMAGTKRKQSVMEDLVTYSTKKRLRRHDPKKWMQ